MVDVKNTYVFHTGIYSKAGYDILRAILSHDYINNGCSLTGGYTYNWEFGPYHTYIHDVGCLEQNFVCTESTGELSFSYDVIWENRNENRNIPCRKVANFINEHSDIKIFTYKCSDCNADVNLSDGIKLIAKHIMNKLTRKDYECPLYKKYIGEPLNPFEQELFIDAKEELRNKLMKYQRNANFLEIQKEIPTNFEPDWSNYEMRVNHWIRKNVTEAFNKMISYLR